MASVRRLKKNVASVLGELVDTLIIWELITDKKNEQSRAIVEEIYVTYDKYLGQINHPTEDKGAFYKITDIYKQSEQMKDDLKRFSALQKDQS